LLNQADEVIFLDDVQYTKRDWRNRNKIVTNNKVNWLTLPVETKGNFLSKIEDIEIEKNFKYQSHLNKIHNSYRSSEFFDVTYLFLEDIYKNNELLKLSKVNILFLEKICKVLEIDLKYSMSREYEFLEDPSLRLMSICKKNNADCYLTGLNAKNYLNEELFKLNDIKIHFEDYSNIVNTERELLYNTSLSIIDYLFFYGFKHQK
jgi:hypothetical protein